MKFTFSWLKEYLDTTATASDVADILNKIGLEVDEFIDYREKYIDFNCVQVVECKNHPNSDHMHVCKVKTKKGELLEIVCGAPNVEEGMKTILAPIGSILPNGTEIKKSKIRGVDSCGMLCSEKELGIGEDYAGIIKLDDNVTIGTNASDIYHINDAFFDISITPNRNDCLCVYGIARDLSCVGLGTLKELEKPSLQENFDSKIKLSVEDENCPVFSFREIRNLNNKESPKWLKDRLLSIGINPRNALVDIGNYVMFCFNTPLHCYDAAKVEEKIVLYPAKDGEEFVDLFNKKHLLKNGNTVIADKKKSICLAGVIGAESSGSSIDTTNVIVECAIFDPINTARTGRQLNLQTDARYRYERGSDHNMIQFALDYTCKLITEICGGEISKTIRYEEENYKKSIEKTLELPLYRVEKLLGLKIEESVIMDILTKNGYKINRKKDILCLDVPSWKNNIMVREDIIDEIIRFYGYEHLRDDGFEKNDIYEQEGNLYFKKLDEKLHQTRKKLVNNGVFEIISYAFTKRKDNEFFTKTNDKLELLNPIISDLSYMRQNILINLINIIKNNNNRSLENLSFFEIGNLFTTNNIDQERIVIGGVRSGNNKDKNIYKDSRKFDIYDVKKDLFDAIGIFKIDASKLLINKNVPDYYHVNRSGAVIMGKTVLGYFGELHPKILKEFDVKQKIVAFELFIDNLPKKMIMGDNERKSYIPNDFQPIERSFSFIIKQEIGVGDIIKSVSSLEKELISDVKLFDIYQEENNKTEKSIAFTVIIQPTNKTLNKEEIDSISDKIVGMIRTSYGGKLKDGKE